MPSCLAAALALPSSREAIPATVTPLACSMPGMTFFMPISAVLMMPQTTGFMRVSFLAVAAILGAGEGNVETRSKWAALECGDKIGENARRPTFRGHPVPLISYPDASPDMAGLLQSWKLPAGVKLDLQMDRWLTRRR